MSFQLNLPNIATSKLTLRVTMQIAKLYHYLEMPSTDNHITRPYNGHLVAKRGHDDRVRNSDMERDRLPTHATEMHSWRTHPDMGMNVTSPSGHWSLHIFTLPRSGRVGRGSGRGGKRVMDGR